MRSIVGTGRCFRMILDREKGVFFMDHALQGIVVQVQVADFNVRVI